MGCDQIVALLLENGADVNSRNYCGQVLDLKFFFPFFSQLGYVLFAVSLLAGFDFGESWVDLFKSCEMGLVLLWTLSLLCRCTNFIGNLVQDLKWHLIL